MPRIRRGCPLLFRFAFLLAVLALALPERAAAEPPREAAESPEGGGADYDPWQRMNRGIFWFNDRADVYVLEPVAKGWDFIMPQPVQDSISNFFANIRFPVVMVNDLLQGKVQPAAIDVGRFMVNTTFGVAGFFDPATDWGLERHYEDFGQTLGVWGVPPGPYLMLPLLGPSNPRDTGGLVVDYGLSVTPFVVPGYVLMGTGAINVVNARSQVIDEVHEAKQASLDYYVFVRNAYYQRRKALVNDQREESGHVPSNDLYDLNVIEDTN